MLVVLVEGVWLIKLKVILFSLLYRSLSPCLLYLFSFFLFSSLSFYTKFWYQSLMLIHNFSCNPTSIEASLFLHPNCILSADICPQTDAEPTRPVLRCRDATHGVTCLPHTSRPRYPTAWSENLQLRRCFTVRLLRFADLFQQRPRAPCDCLPKNLGKPLCIFTPTTQPLFFKTTRSDLNFLAHDPHYIQPKPDPITPSHIVNCPIRH